MKQRSSARGDAAHVDGGDGGPARSGSTGGAATWWRWSGGGYRSPLPLDCEGKARQLRLLSGTHPHMRSFYLATLAHFTAVFATFAAAPLLPVIRDDLDLDKSQVSTAGIAAVAGTILARVAMGGICDRWGPRYGAASLQLLTAAATFGMGAVSNAAGYIAVRFFIGLSMASFVACQFWCSVMFSPRIVGAANAVAAGCGNSAGGFVQLLMPLVLQGMARVQPDFIAWRTCYQVVGWMQVLTGVLVLLFGQDLPGGNYGTLRRQGSMAGSNSKREYWAALRNYRTWVLMALYGFSFGVELTMNNVFANYMYDNFSTSLTTAGALASTFGLSNLVSRPAGGWLSDTAARRFGMRGRLWTLFGLQAGGAAFCCGLSQMGSSLGGTMGMAVSMAVLIQGASGAIFGIVPFITRRGLGVATGLIGSGSSVGSILLQALFFTGSKVDWEQGFLLMGLTALGATFLVFTLHFPMWGGMVPLGRLDAGRHDPGREEEYYAADFTPAERQMGLHHAVLSFAAESKSQRGMRRSLEASNCFGLGEAAVDSTAGGGGGRACCAAASEVASAPGTGKLSEGTDVQLCRE